MAQRLRFATASDKTLGRSQPVSSLFLNDSEYRYQVRFDPPTVFEPVGIEVFGLASPIGFILTIPVCGIPRTIDSSTNSENLMWMSRKIDERPKNLQPKLATRRQDLG